MSLHVFANSVTAYGTAANNRGETEGNVTTLQKLIWYGEAHTTVSAEAIRFALRRLLASMEAQGTNRSWNESEGANEWKDSGFQGWEASNGETFIDDDLLGYMSAEAAKEEGESGSANIRRAVLEVTRAVSLTPWAGDVTFNAASPGATPSAQKKGTNPVPYGTEVHATRYQFGVALTPERLREADRAVKALRAIGNLRTVAGNHGRFLFDFAPDAILLRLTSDPAPRLLYCFETEDAGRTVSAPSVLRKIQSGDLDRTELLLGVSGMTSELANTFRQAEVNVCGVKEAIQRAADQIQLQLKGGES